MSALQINQYRFHSDLKGSKGPISSVVFNRDATLVFIGSDDGHVRVYSTSDFTPIQTLHEPAWGKVTALTCIDSESAADGRVGTLCVGSIRGLVSLVPQAKHKSWFTQRSSKSIEVFKFNDSVAAQVYDAANQRIAIASHSGILKLFSVDGADLIELWTVADAPGVIPISLAFFGGGNQSLLIHKLENGEMTCRDAQTSEVLWQKYLTCAVGHAALSPREDLLLVHNLTESYAQVYRFPGSLPEAILPVQFKRQVTFQGAWAEDGNIAVYGNDHGIIHVLDMATREVIQQLTTRGLIQTVATAQLSNGLHIIIGGSSSGDFCASVWTKQPNVPYNEPTVAHSAAPVINWSRNAERGLILFLFLAIAIQYFSPALALSSLNPILFFNSARFAALRPQDAAAQASVVFTRTVYETAEQAASTQTALVISNDAPGHSECAEQTGILSVAHTVTVQPEVVTKTVTAVRLETQTVTVVTHWVEESPPTGDVEQIIMEDSLSSSPGGGIFSA